MLDFLAQYGMFLAKTLTLVIGFVATFALLLSLLHREKSQEGTFEIVDINDRLDTLTESLTSETLPNKLHKAIQKARNKEKKQNNKSQKAALKKAVRQETTLQIPENEHRLFVIRFDGDMRASGVLELRETITAILTTATPKDEVLVILESGGGFVHSYGLAASQLKRLRQKNIPITVAIDKLAASGGYLMACVANTIIAAPFAIVGSIGVLGQMPNFNKLLTKHNIDFEQQTAGQYKRTLTLFGKNTDKHRHKFQEELEETHQLFKDFITAHRPSIDINKVATGEHWHAERAFQDRLVDKIQTSDDFILEKYNAKVHIFEINYVTKQTLKERLGLSLQNALENSVLTFLNNAKHWRF